MEKIGISNIRIDKIESTEERKFKLLINAKAILNAKQTAESFAKPLNQKVGNAVQISNFENTTNRFGGRISGVVMRGYNTKRYESENPNQRNNFEFEKIKISNTVQARF